MKKYYHILFCLSLLLISCNTKTSKDNNIRTIHEIIKDDVMSSIPKHWEYTPISFSDLDSAFSKVEDTKQYKELYNEQLELDSDFLYTEPVYQTLSADINKKIENLKKTFTPRFIGMKITHIYECKTDFGDSIYDATYIFNDSLKIIEKKVYSSDRI